MPFPPWRKAEYMRSKWLAPRTRGKQPSSGIEMSDYNIMIDDHQSEHGELELIFSREKEEEEIKGRWESEAECGELEVRKSSQAWHPPPVKPESCDGSGKKGVVTGLSFLFRDKS